MMVEDFTTFLKANAGISAIVGVNVFAQNLAQKNPELSPLPGLVYSQISGVRPQTLDGTSGLQRGRYQLACMAIDYKTAKTLSEAVRKALVDFSGTMGSTAVLGVQLMSERDMYNSTSLEFRIDLDFEIWHREP